MTTAPPDGPSGSAAPLSEAARLELRETFETQAQRYAARRPTYPGPLFDALAGYAGLEDGARVLEIAPGTGQATRPMAERGWSVTAVERGAALADLARTALDGAGDIEVVTSAFEDCPLPARPFDAVVCATAWHWLDPAVRLAKAVSALRPGGVLAIVGTHHVAGGSADFFARAQECYRRFDPSAPTGEVMRAEGDLVPSTDELDGSPLLTDVTSALFPQEVTYSTDEYLDLLRTYSTTIRLTQSQREGLLGCLRALLDERAGQVTKRYAFELVLARRARSADGA